MGHGKEIVKESLFFFLDQPHIVIADDGENVAIFELMEWIVNETPPSLPRSHFSSEFCDFVDHW